MTLGFRPSTVCARCILRAHALELGIDPEFTVLTDTDELMDQAVEHVLGRDGARCRARARRFAEGPLRLVSHGGRGWDVLAPVPPSKAWCATCWSYRASFRAAWTMCALRVAKPTPRRLPMPIVRRWVQARLRPRKRRRHSTPSTRLRRAAKPWRMRRDSYVVRHASGEQGVS